MYNINYECNNVVYSLDMLRLKTYISYSTFTELEFRFKVAWKDSVDRYYTTSKMSNFFYNYVIEVEEGITFWFGFLHNTEKRDDRKTLYNLTIEFNPNKCMDNKFIMYILGLSGEWYIKSYDLAMDLKINILDLILDFSGRRQMNLFSHGKDDLTYVFGKGDGRFKVYNKKKEANLNIIGDLTRIEVSRVVDDFDIRNIKLFNYGNKFPTVYLNNYVYSFSDYNDKTLLAVLYAVQHNFPLKDLTKTYRNKVKNLLQGGYKILFDNKTATQVVVSTILQYFMKNPLVIFR